MDRKWIIIILLVSIVIIGIGIFEYDNGFNNNYVKVGSTNFKFPNGYHEGTPNDLGAINITNGEYSIFLVEYNDTNVKKHIDDYEQFIKRKNQSMSIMNYTIDNAVIYKSDNLNNHYNVHYWIVKNNKTYDIYKWDENPKIDYIVSDLVKS